MTWRKDKILKATIYSTDIIYQRYHIMTHQIGSLLMGNMPRDKAHYDNIKTIWVPSRKVSPMMSIIFHCPWHLIVLYLIRVVFFLFLFFNFFFFFFIPGKFFVQKMHIKTESRTDSRLGPGQWETALLCNDVSHWLGANLESALRNEKGSHGS